MNLTQFFEHWRIAENPFRGEEARHDEVFARMERGPGGPGVASVTSRHSDFEKIVGELTRCSTSVVFGEKGSGKTAIRLQLAAKVREHNEKVGHSGGQVMLVSYDELNRFLDQFYARYSGGSKPADVAEVFSKLRLVDHMDGILSLGTGRLVNGLLGGGGEPPAADLGPDAGKRARAMPPALKRDLLALQAVYDPCDLDGKRTRTLRRKLRLGASRGALIWGAATWLGWAPVAAAFWWVLFQFEDTQTWMYTAAQGVAIAVGAAYLGVLCKTQLFDRIAARRWGRRLHKQLRMLGRTTEAYTGSVKHLGPVMRNAQVLPISKSDEPRYAMLDRLRRVADHFGIHGVIVVIDRVDEPTLINGDAERMRHVIWPLFNNKFLQQERFGLKLLLPIELRYALFKESNAFFQEARLDKQNLVERLVWTGATLYDLCNARLAACLVDGAKDVSLLELFAEDVTRQDLVDALDQMHQPRDAFKFIYRCLNEHCSNVTAEEGSWRVPRLVLEHIRKQEADRVQQLERGIRPA